MAWYDGSWSYRIEVTADAAEVDSDIGYACLPLSKMPSEFWANVNATDGRDIRVTTSDGSTEVAVEIVNFDSGTETGLLLWAATHNTSSDESWFVYYGNGSATMPAIDSTYGAENAYPSNHVQVLHLAETGGTTAYDSTANDNDGSSSGSMTSGDNVAGPTSDWPALDFDGSDDMLTTGTGTGFDSNTFTILTWVYKGAASSGYMWGLGTDSAIGNRRIRLYDVNFGGSLRTQLYVTYTGGEVSWRHDTSAEFPAASTWTLMAITMDASDTANDPTFYFDGASTTAPGEIGTPSGSRSTGGDYAVLGDSNWAGGNWSGRFAGWRFLNEELTASDISTIYNMEKPGSTFWTVGGQETSSAGVTAWKTPGTVSQSAGGDGDYPYSSLSNVQTDDSNAATSGPIDTREEFNIIDATNFGFVLPYGASVDGVEMRYRRYSNSSGDVEENVIQLIVGGSATGQNKATTTYWASSAELVTHGGSSDTWTLSPTEAQVEASNFGIRIQPLDDGLGSGDTASIEVIEMRVHYSVGAASATVSGDVDVPGVTVSGTISTGAHVSGDVDIPGVTVAGSISVDPATVSGDANIPGVTVSGTASTGVQAAGDVGVPGIAVSGTISTGAHVSGDVDIPGVTVDGVITVEGTPATVSGDIGVGGVTVSGTIHTGSSVSGDVDVPGLSVAGPIAPPAVASGDISIPGVTVSGTVNTGAHVAGDVDIPGVSAAGTANGPPVVELSGEIAVPGVTVQGAILTTDPSSILADSLVWYLTGADADNETQRNPLSSLGGYRSSQLVESMSWDTRDPMVGIQILALSGGNGRGVGRLAATTTDSITWAPPGSTSGGAVAIAKGEEKTVYGATGAWIRVRRFNDTPLVGIHTVQCIDVFNNVVGMANVASADAVAGETFYRAVMAKNVSSVSLPDLTIWLGDDTDGSIAIALETPSSGAIQSIASETTAPTGLSWSSPTSATTGLKVPVLLAGDTVGLWIRRTIETDTPPSLDQFTNIQVAFTNTVTTFLDALRGHYRIKRLDYAVDGLWVGQDTDPDLTADPDVTFPSGAPYTTSLGLATDHWYHMVRRTRSVLGLWSQNSRVTRQYLNATGETDPTPPSAPTDLAIRQNGDNEAIITGQYLPAPDGANRAEIYVIWHTTDDTTPNTSSTPTGYQVMAARTAIPLLSFTDTGNDLLDGTPVKATVRTRRIVEGDGTSFAPDVTQLPASGPGTIVVGSEVSNWSSTGFLRVATIEGRLQEIVEYDSLVVGSGISTFTVLAGGRGQWGTTPSATSASNTITEVTAVDSENTDVVEGIIDGLADGRPWGAALFGYQTKQAQTPVAGPDGATPEYIDEPNNIYLLLGEGWTELWMDTVLVWKVFSPGGSDDSQFLFIPSEWDIVADTVSGAGASSTFEATTATDVYIVVNGTRRAHIDSSAMTITVEEISVAAALPDVAPQATTWQQYAGCLLTVWNPVNEDYQPYIQLTADGQFNSGQDINNGLTQAEVEVL